MDTLRLIKIIVLMLCIFVGGAVTGILLDRHYEQRSAPRIANIPEAERPEFLLKQFTAAMKLTPEQQERIGPLLKAWGKELAAHPEWTRAQRAMLIESNRSLMVTNLTAEQAVYYDRMLERLRRRHIR
jgi:hypothetical protein